MSTALPDESIEASMRLRDKAIIVTGSTTGIGEAIVRRFAREGARVLVHGRSRERGERVVEELGPAASLHLDDLADSEAADRLVEAALDAFGRIDGIVNNAACTERRTLETTDAAFFHRVFGVNLSTPLLLVRAALDELVRSHGTVLNIGSVLCYSGQKNLLAYSMSKGGLMTMSRNLADYLGPRGVRVNHVNVGWTLTENEYRVKIADGLPENWPDEVSPRAAPSGRLLRPEEIATAAVYWMSDESRPFSGSVVELEQYPIIGRIPSSEDQS